MMNEYQSLLADLLVARPFREAVQVAMAGEAVNAVKAMRAAARNGDGAKAAWFEGQLVALENVLASLERYAKREQT